MNSREQLRIAMVAVPSVAALALFIVSFQQRSKFVRDSEKRQQVERQISDLLKSMESQNSLAEAKKAAVTDEPLEESRYLTFIRSSAQANGIKIVRWASNPRLPATSAPPPTDPNAASPALADVQPLTGTLEVAGPYRQVLSFARALESSDRLYNMSNVSWVRPDNGFDVHLSVFVTRYVLKAPAVTPAGSPGTQPAPANNNS